VRLTEGAVLYLTLLAVVQQFPVFTSAVMGDAQFVLLETLCKIAGAPVTSAEASRFYGVYRVLVVTSGYLTLLTTFIGILKNLDDVAYVMEAARPGFVMLDLIWMHFFIRYSR
jgi:hypothetical protein